MEVTESVWIRAPRERVFAWLLRILEQPRWVGGLRSVALSGPEPAAAGTRLEQRFEHDGRALVLAGELARSEPPAHVVFRLGNEHAEVETAFELEEQGAGTRLTQRSSVRPRGLLARALLAGSTAAAARRAHDDLQRLAELAELGPPPPDPDPGPTSN